MLRPMNNAEAIALAGDLASMTDPADPETVRLCRLASHYRERALRAEDVVDDFLMALSLPVDHCEVEQASRRARDLLALVPKR